MNFLHIRSLVETTDAYVNIHFYSVFVLYCIDGVVIAAQCTATFLRSIVIPKFRY